MRNEMKNLLILCFLAVLCFCGCESSQEQQRRAEYEHQQRVDRILSRVIELRKTLKEQNLLYPSYPSSYYQPFYVPQTSSPSSDEILNDWILWNKEYQARKKQRQQELYQMNMMNSLSGIDSSLDQLRWQHQMDSMFGQKK